MSNISETLLEMLLSKFNCASSKSRRTYQIEEKKENFGSTAFTLFEQLPNELLLQIFSYFNLWDIYKMFYDLNCRFTRLINVSCIRGFLIHSTKENNFYLKHILPNISCHQLNILRLWHNSSYEQLLLNIPTNLCYLNTLALKNLKNLSFNQCRDLVKHFKSVRTLSMVDFSTCNVDWLDDSNWKTLIEIDLPQLQHLQVRILIIYDKSIYEDDKDNIVYSFTSRYTRRSNRIYTGKLSKKRPLLEICLAIDQDIPLRENH